MRSAAPRALRSAAGRRVAQSNSLFPSFSSPSSQSFTSSLGVPARTFSSTTCRREADKGDEPERQWSTPLAKQLGAAISATGPVPLASYMRMCLTADVGGYYTGALEEGRDQFGLKGDFVTSPEISQIFGELIGIWFVAEWMAQGRPSSGTELIEVGPGRGTLMADMLRTIQSFPKMASSIDAIYMVEASAELREAQKTLLCGPDATLSESKVGWHSVCKNMSIPVVWTDTIKSIPNSPSKTPFIVAHEFFDALPIHAFQCVSVPSPSPSPSTNKPTLQWRELLVSPTPPAPTRHALYLPESSPRFRAIKTGTGAGAVIEICPDASLYASDFAARIGGSALHPKPRPSGAALVLDYGPGDGSVPTNSLRGIRRHARVSPFAEPGLTDLSADVDFAGIAEAAMQASEGVEVHGPVEQAGWLLGMGGQERAEVLMRAAGDKEAVEGAWRRLVERGPNGMGRLYKVMAILPEGGGRRKPVGFGGEVVQ
ncbi:S-adenosyl-L-methionine-dependent methyltransferase [Schizothecium vesticola]|uniref:Protein arginine methyltransferase NDUFAF7 n=1 Tax=Schizothecium vesticola TaxID=314040 RepID=A0AA40F8H5_9PEZI|nr:S-adenosyl-L-methionine-dependent methyltransferase [Schizothecium vesticola]